MCCYLLHSLLKLCADASHANCRQADNTAEVSQSCAAYTKLYFVLNMSIVIFKIMCCCSAVSSKVIITGYHCLCMYVV